MENPSSHIKKSSSKIEKEEEDPPDSSLFIEKKKFLILEPRRRIGSFLVVKNDSKTPKISYEINKDHFGIKVFDKFRYSVKYPEPVFADLDRKKKETLLDNFTYCKTIPLSLISNPGLFYQTKKPFLKDFIDYGLEKDLPRVCEIAKLKPSPFFKKIDETNITFQDEVSTRKLLPPEKCSEKKIILSISFGKDSLLTYGLLKELGWDFHLVFVNDMEKYNPNELKLKKEIIKTFSKEQREKVIILTDDTDNIFRNPKIKNNIAELDGTNAMLSFALELIPVAYGYLAKYIIFGNEKNLDDFFVNGEKIETYPSYDQSSIYTKMVNRYLEDLTNDNIEIVSLIKPLYNIAEVKILYHRYPHLLKYIMSCSSQMLKDKKWCGECHTCFWGFLYGAAVGNPEKIGLKENFFKKKYLNFCRLFNPNIQKVYEKPPAVRDEQLLAFYLAYKNGYKGELINLFKKLYLKEAKNRERELRKKFFGIHSTNTLPEELKDKVLKIYREELKDLGR